MKNLSFLLLLILNCSCNSDFIGAPVDPIDPIILPDTLPPITMTGENTFGFLLDGEVWIPKDDLSTNPFKNLFHTISYEENSGGFRLQVENIDTITSSDHFIDIYSIFSDVGIFKMPPPPYNGIVFTDFNLSPCKDFKSDWDKESSIEIIRLDKTERIVAGTFEYTAHNDCGDTIRITEGRFDYNY